MKAERCHSPASSWLRHGARFSTRSMIDHTWSTQGVERSRAFQISPTRPPGRSTRWNSARATGASNQWNACATTMPCNDSSAKGSASAVADAMGTSGSASCSTPDMPATGSTASRTAPPSWQYGTSSRVNFPVPAARSTTREPCCSCSASTSHATASAGYEGRARSYAPASVPKPTAATSWTPRPAGRSDQVAGAADGVQPCRPHSSLPLSAQRPARGSSPSLTGLVHGQQPIDGYPLSVSGCDGRPRSAM